ncbi:transcriptional activator FlhC [Aeromonas salmonicida]|uniref:Transcriptional activator FlhC n=2 Tax=Aeromonadaceae TaxID=84642 RepID=A0AAX1PC07_AERSA|nr:FlhC family transcriptional regulator [Aeromonas salmonicida]RAI97819.1 transcriptional activator FlhC [Aeromonas salmonicida]
MITGGSGLGQLITARHMVLAGYINYVITLETGLTYKQIRKLRQELKGEGFTVNQSKSRAVRGGATLIHSHSSKIQASLLMQLYSNIGGPGVTRSINVAALGKAFRMYHAIRKEVPGLNGPRWEAFDISDAWCLAKELRTGDAMMELCKHCNCTFFTSFNQRTCVECPYCKEQSSSRDSVDSEREKNVA